MGAEDPFVSSTKGKRRVIKMRANILIQRERDRDRERELKINMVLHLLRHHHHDKDIICVSYSI